jgi:predicted amidohydrolase
MLRHPYRPVTIASICGRADAELILALVREAASGAPDLIILPENWQHAMGEPIDSPTICTLRTTARESRVYIVDSVNIREADGRLYNSAILIDRKGEIAGRYDKAYPYWSEITDDPQTNTIPGSSKHVFDTDFGRLGLAICFDANFPELWADMAEQNAELVVWPSAYAAGMQLAAHALNYHYPIVTSSEEGVFLVFDIDGQRLVHTNSERAHIEWVTLDLDRCIFHENFNRDKLNTLLVREEAELEKHLQEEQWLVVRACKPDISARTACAEVGMEELRAYKRRSRLTIDEFRAKAAPSKGA